MQMLIIFVRSLYSKFKKNGIDIIYDDRDERPGIKFSDADLLVFHL